MFVQIIVMGVAVLVGSMATIVVWIGAKDEHPLSRIFKSLLTLVTGSIAFSIPRLGIVGYFGFSVEANNGWLLIVTGLQNLGYMCIPVLVITLIIALVALPLWKIGESIFGE